MRLAVELVNHDKGTVYARGVGACILRHSAGSRSTLLLGQWCASPGGEGSPLLPFYVTLDPYSLIAGTLVAPALLCSLPFIFLSLRTQGVLSRNNKDGREALLELGARLALLLLFVACSLPVDLVGHRVSRTEGLGGWVVLVLATVLFVLALAWGGASEAALLWTRLFWSVPEALRSRLPPKAPAAVPQRGTLFQQSLFVQVPLLCVLAEVVSNRRDALLDVGSSFVVGVLGAVLGAVLQECGALYDVFRRQRRWMRRMSPSSEIRSSAAGGRGLREHKGGSPWRLDSAHAGTRVLGRASVSGNNTAVLRIVRGFHAR